jgi:hypothetical protein
MTFATLYGTDLDTELGTTDQTVRMTTALRKAYINEGQRVFNEQTSCFVKRVALPISDDTQEYDLETSGIIAAQDYLWPAKTSASLKRVGASTTAYTEGPELAFTTEEELNQTEPNWRAQDAAMPRKWYLREDGGASYIGLHPTPDVPAAETWTLLWPYVAQPADMTLDADEPFTASSNILTTLRPYHKALVFYAAAQLEKRRKDYEAVERNMAQFAAYVAKYRADRQPKIGTQVRLAQDYRTRLRGRQAIDFYRYP